jgi:hypothetical protein
MLQQPGCGLLSRSFGQEPQQATAAKMFEKDYLVSRNEVVGGLDPDVCSGQVTVLRC